MVVARHPKGAVAAVVASLFLLLAACGSAPRNSAAGSSHGPAQVVLFGDSLAYQAAPYFDWLVQANGGATVKNFVFGGTAACDWLPTMRTVARTRPQIAVLEFSGNTFTSCMQGCPAESPSAIERYCTDITTAITLFLHVGTRVFLAGTPITEAKWLAHDPHWNDLNRAFAQLAAKYPSRVTYIDAGRSVEGPGQSFVSTLPCLSFEPCDGPTVDGVETDVVRSPDGVHFCTGGPGNPLGLSGPCLGYSSGAYRFASAMAGPVIRVIDRLSPTTRPADS